jgi:glycosyltransferase involved in cell wall biosynthesis
MSVAPTERLNPDSGSEKGKIMKDPNTPSAAVSVIIPAYNEEDAVDSQVNEVRDVLTSSGIGHEIIVIDDGSDDRTAEKALQAGARVLRHLNNQGYGSALMTGILAATHDTIMIIDADKTYPVDQIPALLSQLENADMVVGARVGRLKHLSLVRRLGKLLLGWLANRVAGQRIPDLNSGLRVFRREYVLQYFHILPKRFSFTTTITLAMLADNYRILYHPIKYHQRVGKSKITPFNFMEFITLVFRIAILFQPLKVFLPLALTCFSLGLMKFFFDIAAAFRRAPSLNVSLLFQPVLSTSAILLLLVGLQLFLIGMVADGLLRRIGQRNKPLKPSRAMRTLELGLGERSPEREAPLKPEG